MSDFFKRMDIPLRPEHQPAMMPMTEYQDCPYFVLSSLDGLSICVVERLDFDDRPPFLRIVMELSRPYLYGTPQEMKRRIANPGLDPLLLRFIRLAGDIIDRRDDTIAPGEGVRLRDLLSDPRVGLPPAPPPNPSPN